jgi:integrase
VLAERRSQETVNFYKTKAGHLIRYFEQADEETPRTPFLMKTLRARHVDGFIEQRRVEGAAESTIQKELTTLRATLKLAKRRDLWHGDIDAVMPSGFSPQYKPRERFLTGSELPLLLRELPGPRAAVVAFIVATSAEWRAVERAQPSDVAPDQSVVQLRGTKRATRHRPVPIVTENQKRLLRYALQHAESTDDLLLLPWSNVRRDLRDACERAGIPPCSPNDLRRTFAHWLRAERMPLELIAPVMSHADTRMVERVYRRFTQNELISRMKAAIGFSDRAPQHSDSVPPSGLPGLGAPSGEPCVAGFSVPRDGVEPPTRGFSILSTVLPLPRKTKVRANNGAPRTADMQRAKPAPAGGARATLAALKVGRSAARTRPR